MTNLLAPIVRPRAKSPGHVTRLDLRNLGDPTLSSPLFFFHAPITTSRAKGVYTLSSLSHHSDRVHRTHLALRAACARTVCRSENGRLTEGTQHHLSRTKWLLLEEVCLYVHLERRFFRAKTFGIGPGGYVAAIKAAQLGLRVCV